jgi:hypothetical protein
MYRTLHIIIIVYLVVEKICHVARFCAKEGHCLVPQLHPTLGECVKKQRAAYDDLMNRGVKSDCPRMANI